VPAAESTVLWVADAPGGAPLALTRAVNEARKGDVPAVAVRLAEAFGWLPPAPLTAEEVAAWQARQAELARQQPQPGAPWTRPDTSSVDVDAQGNALPPQMPARQPHPSDAYMPHGAAAGIGVAQIATRLWREEGTV
jgi:hypothetical protein